MLSRLKPAALLVTLLLIAMQAQTPAALAQPANLDTAFFALPLEGFFPGDTKGGQAKRINIYLVRRDGKWVSGLGTATINGKPVWNTALMPVDASALTINGNKLAGTMTITLVPDPWVPRDQKVRVATATIDGTIGPAAGTDTIATATGSWTSKIEGDAKELAAASLSPAGQGTFKGGIGNTGPNDLADASYDLAVYQLIPGKTTEPFQRRRALSLGVKAGKVVSARLGQMDIRHVAYDYQLLETPENVTITGDDISGTVTFMSETLEGEAAEFTLQLTGRRVAGWLAGSYKGKYSIEGKEQEISGYFRGDVRKGAFVSEASKDTRPWYAETPGHVAVAAGEHPRLFFRKSDVAELKRRAETPEGQAIVKRLRQILNGTDGNSLPTSYSPAKQAYDKTGFKAKPGAFSISSAAGYGFLYQLTGNRMYADLARQCVEKGFEGQRSYDDRYAWVAPGGELRAGPSVGWTAVAYDLCYEGWDEAFRQKVALAIQNYADTKGGEWNVAEGITLNKMIMQPRQGPGSNHYGAVVGGSGLAVLAIKGDPGVDRDLVDKYCQVVERQVVRHLSAGWGDGGYYKEGWGASRVGTQGGFLCLLQALKISTGHDYLNVERNNASFVTLVPRVLMVLGNKDHAYFPYRSNMGPTYGNPEIGSDEQNSGFSHGGMFSEGLGAVADKYKPALLWAYNHLYSPNNDWTYDTLSLYAHRPMLALINWPTFSGVQEQNPATVIPLATRDHLYDYFVFRNGFNDAAHDVVTTVAINYPDGTKPRGVMVWGMGGLRLEFGEPKRGGRVTHYASAVDGSGTLTAGDFAMAVDHSRASGADVVVVTINGGTPKADPKAASNAYKISSVTAGKTTFNILTLSAAGTHPEPKANGDNLAIGNQTFTFADGKLTMSTFTPTK